MAYARITPEERIKTTEQAEGLPLLMDARQAGALLGISDRQALNMAKSGKLPATQVGTRWRFNRDKLLSLAGIE